MIVAPRRFWFGEAGELRGEVKALPLVHLMPTHGWQQHRALKHGGKNDRGLIEWQLRDLPRELREELLQGLRKRARAQVGNKRTHDHELIIGEVWNSIEHRGMGKEQALHKVAARHRITSEWARRIFARGDGGDIPVWVTGPPAAN